MTMAFKYQILLCPRPKDILLITFNHLDAIKEFIYESPKTLTQVDVTFRRLIDVRARRSCALLKGLCGKCMVAYGDK